MSFTFQFLMELSMYIHLQPVFLNLAPGIAPTQCYYHEFRDNSGAKLRQTDCREDHDDESCPYALSCPIIQSLCGNGIYLPLCAKTPPTVSGFASPVVL